MFQFLTYSALTVSGDGTSHKNIHYESCHITLNAPSHLVADPDIRPRTQLISVAAAINHASDTQLAGWKSEIAEIMNLFNQSPLAKRERLSLSKLKTLLPR